MFAGFTVTKPAKTLPVDRNNHLKVRLGDVPETDQELDAFLIAAVDQVEQVTGLALQPQTCEVTYDSLQSLGKHTVGVLLPRWPFIAIDSFEYRDTEGDWQQMPAENYEVDPSTKPTKVRLRGSPPTIHSQELPAYRIEFRTGYPEDKVPAGLKAAIMMAVEGDLDGCECPGKAIGGGGVTDHALKVYEVPKIGYHLRVLSKPTDSYAA